VLFIFAFQIYGQSISKQNLINNQNNQTVLENELSQLDENGWRLNHIISNVEFYSQISECKNQKAIFIKIVNKNNCKVNVSWKELIDDSVLEKKHECIKGEKSITINPDSIVQGDCSDSESANLIILSSEIVHTHNVEIKGFEFKDIKVNHLK